MRDAASALSSDTAWAVEPIELASSTRGGSPAGAGRAASDAIPATRDQSGYAPQRA